jgi:hypothetical protein
MNQAIKGNMVDTLNSETMQNNADLHTAFEKIGTDSDNLFQVMINPLALKDVSKDIAAQV